MNFGRTKMIEAVREVVLRMCYPLKVMLPTLAVAIRWRKLPGRRQLAN